MSHPTVLSPASLQAATPRWPRFRVAAALTLAAFGLHAGCSSSTTPDPAPACDNGITETRACGTAGTQTRLCTDGEWGAFGACEEDTACTENATRPVTCPVDTEGGEETCKGGVWTQTSACTATVIPDCDDGRLEIPCGHNDRGTQTEVCEGGQIVDPGTCDDPDVCLDNDTRNAPCGTNGLVPQRCVDGQWDDTDACEEFCVDGTTDTTSCGRNDNGTQTLLCTAGEWAPSGTCNDPDVCTNGVRETLDCDAGDFGHKVRTCNAGQWSTSSCTGNSVDLSYWYGCAVRNGGHVLCWGGNSSGQLGVGHTNDVTAPVHVKNLTNAKQVATANNTACALTDNGDVYCWGSGSFGSLGNNSDADSTLPVRVPSLTNVRQIVAGSFHFCALRENFTVACWGRNDHGQLGIDTVTERWEPTQALNLSDVSSIHATETTTCARKRPGSLYLGPQPTDTYCWGNNEHRVAGILNNTAILRVPTKIAGQTFESVALTTSAFCGVAVSFPAFPLNSANHTVRCVGRNSPTQGDGIGTTAYTAFHTALLGHTSQVAQSARLRIEGGGTGVSETICGLVPANNTLSCWGDNHSASLGRGYTGGSTSDKATPIALFYRTPNPLGGGNLDVVASNLRQFAVGGRAVCVITDRGQLQCTGAYSPNASGILGTLPNIPAKP